MAGVRELPDAITKRVCAALGASGLERAQRVQRLWSGYGQLVRVWPNGAGSFIVKHVQPPAAAGAHAAERRAHERKLRSYAVELQFYERYARQCTGACTVAAALLCERRDDEFLFVLEDLDAQGYSERRERLPLTGVRACLSWLAHFHATFVGTPAADLWPVGTYWHLDTRPDELARMSDRALRAAASWLDARLRGARFRTLVHGDAKVENFCFSRDLTQVAAVDFQYVGLGTGVQDIAYFFSSCLDDRECEAHAPALLDHYFAALRAALGAQRADIDAAALEAEWRELYAIAWADFSRFMDGWAPRQPRGRYAERMTALALTTWAATRQAT